MLKWALCSVVLPTQAFMIKGTVKSANVEVGFVFSGTNYNCLNIIWFCIKFFIQMSINVYFCLDFVFVSIKTLQLIYVLFFS